MMVTPATGLAGEDPFHSMHILAFVPISWVKPIRRTLHGCLEKTPISQ